MLNILKRKRSKIKWNNPSSDIQENTNWKGKLLDFFKNERLDKKVIIIDILILIIIFFITHLGIFGICNPFSDGEEASHLQNIFALHAGITALIFPIVFFIAEKLKADNKDEGTLLIRESYLWHIVFFGTTLFLNFIFLGEYLTKVTSYLTLIVYTIGVLYSIRSIIKILLDPIELNRKRIDMYTSRMGKYTSRLIDTRIRNNKFAQYISDRNDVNLDLFSTDDENNGYYNIKSKELGLIVDIDENALSRFINEVIKKLGKGKQYRNTQLENSGTEQIARGVDRESRRKVLIKFYKTIDMRISPQDNKIIGIWGLDNQDIKIIKDLTELSKNIFTVDYKKKSPDEEVKYEIEVIRDNLIKNIRENNIIGIKRRIEELEEILEVFLKKLAEIKSTYSFEAAEKESSNLFDRWSQIDSVQETIDDALHEAYLTDNQKIIKQILYSPMSIVRNSVDYGEHLIFQSFIRYMSRVYFLSHRRKEQLSDSLDFIFDRSFRYLSELVNYIIIPKVERENDTSKIKDYEGYIKYVMKTFINLIKISYDEGNLDHFKKFLKEFKDIARYFDSKIRRMQKKEQHQETINTKIKLKETIEKDKQDILFGISAYVLNDLVKKKKDGASLFFNVLREYLPDSVEKLTKIFIRVHNFDKGELWGWDWWNVKADQGRMTAIDTLPNVERLYAVIGLELLKNYDENRIDNIDIEPSRDLYYLADGSRELLNILESIKKGDPEWKGVIENITDTEVEKFKKLLNVSKTKQEELDKKEIIESELDSVKIKKFKEEISESYNKNIILRSIFKKQDKEIISLDEYTKEPEARGYNHIESKEVFMKNWHVHYSDFGMNFGYGIAQTEDQLILKGLSMTFSTLTDTNDLKNIKRNFIALYVGGHFYELLENNPIENCKFISKWQMQQSVSNSYVELLYDYIEGFMKIDDMYIPVIDFNFDSKNKELIIFNPETLGNIENKKPLEEITRSQIYNNAYSLQLIDLSKNKTQRDAIIKTNPKWLNDISYKESHLKQKVHIKIFEKLEYIPSNKEVGFKIDIK